MSGSRQLRIAAIVNRFPSATETFVTAQISGLVERGHDVTIYSMKPGDRAHVHNAVHRHDLLSRTREFPVEAEVLGSRLRLLPAMVRRIGDSRAVLRSIDPRRHGGRALSLRVLRETAAVAPAESYDVIHAHFGLLGLTALRQQSIGMLQGPIVTSFHGLEMSRYVQLLERGEYKPLFERGRLFLPVSALWREHLVRFGAPPDRTLVHRMGVDVDAFPFVDDRRSNNGRFELLSVGRLVGKKGFDDAIAAVRELCRMGAHVRYQIVGDGPLRPRLEQLIERQGLVDVVELRGWTESSDVRRLMQTSDLLLAPSRTDSSGDMEGLPLVIMEAMALGLPVLTTYHSGIPELVRHRQTGFIVGEAEPQQLAQMLIELWSEPSTRNSVSVPARQAVERSHNNRKLNDALSALLIKAAS